MVINTDPDRRELVVFGLVLPVTVVLLGLLIGRLVDSAIARNILWGSGAVLFFLYLAVPPIRRPVFVGASRVTYPIGWVVSHLVLFVVFWLVVTPIALLLRVLGKDPMRRKFDDFIESYWEPRGAPEDVESYFRQF
jgi:Saxitoxin biosynthesis operon protein SxtJ